MTENSAASVVFIAGGAAVGAGVSATVGGMGLVGGFGGVGIGMSPVTAAGAVAGAAAYGAFRAIGEGDAAALGAIGFGALGGAGVSAAVGGMGLSFSGTAVSIGISSMAAVGGVVGLGLYGIAKLINSSDAGSNFSRNMQALAEIIREYEEKMRWAALEVEEELQVLKTQLKTKTELKLNFAPSTSFNPVFTPPVNLRSSATTSAAQENQFTAPETEADVLSIEAVEPQTWRCVHTFKGHSSSVNSVAFSPNGQTLASGDDNGLIYLWNLKTGQRLSTFFLYRFSNRLMR